MFFYLLIKMHALKFILVYFKLSKIVWRQPEHAFLAQLRLRIFYFKKRGIRFRPPAVRDEGRKKNLQRSKFMSTFMCDCKFWAPQSDIRRNHHSFSEC